MSDKKSGLFIMRASPEKVDAYKQVKTDKYSQRKISVNQEGKLYRAYAEAEFAAIDSAGFYSRKSTNGKIRLVLLGKVSDHVLQSTSIRPDYVSAEEAPDYPDFNQPQAAVFVSKAAEIKGGDDGFFHIEDEEIDV